MMIFFQGIFGRQTIYVNAALMCGSPESAFTYDWEVKIRFELSIRLVKPG